MAMAMQQAIPASPSRYCSARGLSPALRRVSAEAASARPCASTGTRRRSGSDSGTMAATVIPASAR